MSSDNYLYAPSLSGDEQPQSVTVFNVDRMTLAQVLTTLIDHQFTFEQLRELRMVEIVEAIDRVNSGELISWDERKRREKAQKGKSK